MDFRAGIQAGDNQFDDRADPGEIEFQAFRTGGLHDFPGDQQVRSRVETVGCRMLEGG